MNPFFGAFILLERFAFWQAAKAVQAMYSNSNRFDSQHFQMEDSTRWHRIPLDYNIDCMNIWAVRPAGVFLKMAHVWIWGKSMAIWRWRFTRIQSLAQKMPLPSPIFPSTCSTSCRMTLQQPLWVDDLPHIDSPTLLKNCSRRCVKSSRMDILLTFSPTPNKGRRDHGFIEFSMASKKATTRSWSKTVRAPPWRRGCLLMLCGCCIIQDVHIYIYTYVYVYATIHTTSIYWYKYMCIHAWLYDGWRCILTSLYNII